MVKPLTKKAAATMSRLLVTTIAVLFSLVIIAESSSATTGPFGFPAEEYLNASLPNYPQEYVSLTIKLAMCFVFWVVIFPLVATNLTSADNTDDKKNNNNKTNDNIKENTTSKTSSKTGATRSKKKKLENKLKGKKTEKIIMEVPTIATKQEEEPQITEIDFSTTIFSTFCFMIHFFYLLIVSNPHSYFIARGVFQVPLFLPEECETLLQMAHQAAQENYQQALQTRNVLHLAGEEPNNTISNLLVEPLGWQKTRHDQYPTTDLNIITDPFTKEDREWLEQRLHQRLSPILQRIFGIPPSAIRANDMFVVRYDEGMRTHLANHTDDGHISINVLLTDTFEGGGTQFYNRNEDNQPWALVQPKQVGQMLTHTSALNHEGVHVTSGTRIIFVGFLSIDSVDPFQIDKSTGLSWYNSWLSLSWLAIKFKEGYHSVELRRLLGDRTHNEYGDKWYDNPYTKSFFLDMANFIQIIGDMLVPHHLVNLVAEEQATEYLNALDKAYQETGARGGGGGQASWFKGQQIDIDIDGTITRDWVARRSNVNRFMEL